MATKKNNPFGDNQIYRVKQMNNLLSLLEDDKHIFLTIPGSAERTYRILPASARDLIGSVFYEEGVALATQVIIRISKEEFIIIVAINYQ